MTRFIIFTFLMLGWAFYEMSGGADFEPRGTREIAAAARAAEEAEAKRSPNAVVVTRDLPAITNTVAPTLVAATQEGAPKPVSAVPHVPAAFETAEARREIILVSDEGGEAGVPTVSLAALDRGDLDVVAPLDAFKPGVVVPATLATIEEAATEAEPAPDLRRITGSRVNMRNGPGTQYDVLARLTSGDEVIVLADPGTGWLKLQPKDGGPVGWMADFLVSDPEG
ncbi:MAG: SH3 domain-containing protein [Pseudomonadota bacterium]